MKFFNSKVIKLIWVLFSIVLTLIFIHVLGLQGKREGMSVRAGGQIDPNYEAYFVRPLCVNKPDSEVYRYGAPGTDRDPKKRHDIFKVTYPTRPSVTGMFDTTGPLGYNSVECDQNSICKRNKTPNKKSQ